MLNLKQKLLSLKQSNPEDISISQPTDNLYFDVSNVDANFHPKESNRYKLFSVIICILFICIFIVDSYLNSKLNSLKNVLDQKIIENDKNLDLESKYISVADSLNTYKRVETSKTSIYPRIQLIYTDLPEGLNLNSLKIMDKTFGISLSSGNVLLISQFVASISRNPLVSNVILESATLNSGTDMYIVDLRGTFK